MIYDAPTPSGSQHDDEVVVDYDVTRHHDYGHYVRWMRHLQEILPGLAGDRRNSVRAELARTRQIVEGWSGPKRDHFFDWRRHLEENLRGTDPVKQPARHRELADELERVLTITATMTAVDCGE